jgi:hypothetical protein
MAKERNAPMSVAILYHNPKQPTEVGITVVANLEDVPEHVERLKQRGFVIDEISDHVGDRPLQSK